MQKNTDPVIDQKVIEQKKSPVWPWILLGLIVLGLLAWWLLGNNKHEPVEQAPATIATTAPEQQIESPVNAVNSSTAATDNNNVISELESYYAGSQTDRSDSYNISAIDFASGSAQPQVTDQATVQRLAEVLNAHPQSQVVLRGYADATGTDQINDPLSAQRAEAVKGLLVDQNVDASRISVDGRGDEHPIATNQSAAGRDINRRVTIYVNGK